MLRGVFPPLPTAFTDDVIDEGVVREMVTRLMQTRLAGVLLLGTNGEAPFVSEAEADRLVRVTRSAVPAGRPLLVGTGRDSTRATIDACRRAADLGATHALVRPPTWYTPLLTQDVLRAHYMLVADSSPIPVLLYNQPAVFGADLAASTVATLAAHPNIAGLKDSSGNIAHVSDVLARVPHEFSVMTGAAAMMYASLLSGTSGSIVAVANVTPSVCVQLYDLVMAGELHKALALQRALAPLGRAVTVQYGVPGLKAAMALVGHGVMRPRLPLLPAAPAVVEDIAMLLRTLEEFTGARLLAVAS